MNKNFVLLMLFLLIGMNFFGIYILEFPFYEEILIILMFSMLMLSLIPERYVFVLSINLILSYGLFLVVHAIVNNQSSTEVQMLYLFSHLLFTSVILICWILLNYIKKTGSEYEALKQENKSLKKYQEGKDILTIPGFNEQAMWVIADSKINQTEAWFLKLKVTNKHPKIKSQIQKSLEETAQSLVRKHYDLITSTDGHIYILLKNASQEYVDEITEAFFSKIRDKFNLLEPPVFVEKALVVEESIQVQLKGRAK